MTFGCSEDNFDSNSDKDNNRFPYAAPTILSPADRTEKYSSEIIVISWKNDANNIESEFQFVSLPNYYVQSNLSLFDHPFLNGGFSNQFEFRYFVDENISNAEYTGFRVRSVGINGKSDWSQIISMKFNPINNLLKDSVEVKYSFSFKTNKINPIYSDTVLSQELNIEPILALMGRQISNLKVARPISGYFVTEDDSNICFDYFDRIIVGYGKKPSNNGWPLTVISDTYPGQWKDLKKAEVSFTYEDSRYLNLKDILVETRKFKIAYILKNNTAIGAPVELKFYLKLYL